MRIFSLTVQDFKRIIVAAINPDQSVVQITGANGSGKSSVLDSIMCALGGAAGHPTEPIRQGAERAVITLDLGEFIVTRRFTEGGTYLDVATKEGAKYPKPQQMLDKMLGALSFDPLAFSRLAPKAQLEQLRRIVTLDVDLDALDASITRDYTARTEVNREVKSLAERVTSLATTLDEGDTEPVDVNSLLDQLTNASAHNAAIEADRARRNRRAEVVVQMQRKIYELEEQVIAIRQHQDALGQQMLAAETQERNDPALATPIDVSLLRVAVDEATAENAARAQRARNRAEHAKAVEQHAERARVAEGFTASITGAEARKRDAIARANMPVPGLSFGEGTITYNGLPLAQASSAEQLRVATAIGMALNPRLRILTIKDGSLLDETSLALLEQMAETHDFQVWLERVDTSGSVGITMVDGTVAAVNGEPVADPEALADDGELAQV